MKSQNGNALFLILIAVALFAALSYALTSSGRGGGNINKETTTISASQAIQMAGAYETAVNRMKITNGCNDTEFTFEEHSGNIKRADNTTYSFVNALAPSDKRCHFFNKNGGGITDQLLPENITIPASSIPSGWMHPRSLLLMRARVLGVGSDAATADGTDLILWMGRLTKEACIEINNKLGINNPSGNPPSETFDAGTFTGAYSGAPDPIGGVADLIGKRTFCIEKATDGFHYILVQVVLAR